MPRLGSWVSVQDDAEQREDDAGLTGARRALDAAAQVEIEIESKVEKRLIIFWIQVLRSRRFQSGFDRVSLHRSTWISVSGCFSSAARRAVSWLSRYRVLLHNAKCGI